MSPLVRRYLKTAIAFLLIGLGLGFWMLLGREFGVPVAWRLRSAHTHALLVGFVLMMIAGVALWMFPRPRAGEAKHHPLLAEIAWWGIAGGTGVRVLLESWPGTHQGVAWRATIVVAAALQVAGLGLFFVALWPRIRSSGAKTEVR
ncbi:MAG: cbb3-type cytochrome c oxidase subunit I [Gemmatimonadaceae bacterium]|nr:cbb3-type cytochrome c oxidase subunit I [Gemmatimonadaceae bacterium]